MQKLVGCRILQRPIGNYEWSGWVFRCKFNFPLDAICRLTITSKKRKYRLNRKRKAAATNGPEPKRVMTTANSGTGGSKTYGNKSQRVDGDGDESGLNEGSMTRENDNFNPRTATSFSHPINVATKFLRVRSVHASEYPIASASITQGGYDNLGAEPSTHFLSNEVLNDLERLQTTRTFLARRFGAILTQAS